MLLKSHKHLCVYIKIKCTFIGYVKNRINKNQKNFLKHNFENRRAKNSVQFNSTFIQNLQK